jgi:flagellar hook-associated protein 2
MAINPTSSATSGIASTSALGKGTTIDIDTIVSKLDAIEQAPIDKLGIRVTKQENALADLGTIKSKMAIFQAALQDFTDPVSYLNKSVSSGNGLITGAAISESSKAQAGVYNVTVSQLAAASTKTFQFDFTFPSTIEIGASDGESQQFDLGGADITSLTALRDAINQSSAESKVRASLVTISGTSQALSLTSTTGGSESDVDLITISGPEPTSTGSQDGADSIFTVNGQEFIRPSNIVDEALAGVRLQIQGVGSTTISVNSGGTEVATTLLTNLGQAFNDLIASYTEFSKFNSDPEKRGSLYGFMDLRTLIDSISLTFMQPLTRSGQPLLDINGNPISFTSLGLELQLDGTLLFDAAIYESAVTSGALDEISNGSVSPTRVMVNDAMTFGGRLDSFISSFEEQKLTIENRIRDLEERKIEKMARYKAQYAALDALLFRLQSLNASLTPTFEALNNRNNN